MIPSAPSATSPKLQLARSASRKLASLHGSPKQRRSMTANAGASAGAPDRIRKGASVSELPPRLGFRRAAILGLPKIEVCNRAGPAGLVQQLEQKRRARQSLLSAHDVPLRPVRQHPQRFSRSVAD